MTDTSSEPDRVFVTLDGELARRLAGIRQIFEKLPDSPQKVDALEALEVNAFMDAAVEHYFQKLLRKVNNLPPPPQH